MGLLLEWGLPVLIGAGIGYLTNVVAIRMLFRPLTEKRLFGIRIPLTPGIIPRNRHKLAVGIANTVSRELLNGEVLSERLSAPDVSASVKKASRGILDEFLDAPLARFSGAPRSEAALRLSGAAASLVEAFASSPAFFPSLERAAAGVVEALGGVSLARALGMERAGVAEAAAARILDALCAEGPSALAREKALSLLDAWLDGEKPLRDVLPFDPAEAASRVLHALYPQLLAVMEELLSEPANREAMEARGRDVVGDLLKRLNVVQRFFVQAGQYDKKILENMDQTVEELLAAALSWAQREDSRSLVCARAADAVRKWTAMTPAQLKEKVPGLRTSLEELLDRALRAFRDGRFRDPVSRALAAGIRGAGKMSLVDAAKGIFALDAAGLAGLLASAVSGFASGQGPKRLAAAALSALASFLDENGDKSLGALFSLGQERRQEAAAWLGEKALAILRQRAGQIVQAIDIRETVIAKIDALDLLSLERLVLDIMSEQFVWIDIFGAILGALIGLIQVLLSRIL